MYPRDNPRVDEHDLTIIIISAMHESLEDQNFRPMMSSKVFYVHQTLFSAFVLLLW